MTQAVGPISSSIVGTGKRICFAAEVESEVPRQLHRAPTPYPKELRNLARHARNLHHQSTHDHRIHLEQETLIKEAIIAKATTTLDVTSESGTCFSQSFFNKGSHSSLSPCDRHALKGCKTNSPTEPGAEYSISEESSDEANKTVLAKEKSPDIREAKYIRNPTSEYHAKPPTVADYVNSTWKPDEYSKANTAKIVESDKFTEPYKNIPDMVDSKCLDQTNIQASKVNEIPPVPPPYHIAAAFSKKAALFQQLNQLNQPDSKVVTPLQPELNTSISEDTFQESPTRNLEGNDELYKTEEYVHLSNEKIQLNTAEISSSLVNNGQKHSLDTMDHAYITQGNSADSEHAFESDRCFKPSRIPILKTKHLDNINSASSTDLSTKCTNASAEDYETLKVLNASCIPTSPITGKKYRSPLSTQPKLFDRSKKMTNGTISNNNVSCDNSKPLSIAQLSLSTDMAMNLENKNTDVKTSYEHVTSSVKNSTDIKNETNSGRSTPVSVNNKLINDINDVDFKKYQITTNQDVGSEKKPRFKWMFGPHKNANVLPVQIRKNPGLGFSIAGGVAGAETGIIVTKVNPDGPAQGTLRPGDKILEVDGIDFTKSDHNNAVAVLRATGAVVSMMISRHQ
ncbi:hypothetical protein KM043_009409 [Ampulex compressa]|nr:hypothetical protein KM043_009409 [Ampulex compressa]